MRDLVIVGAGGFGAETAALVKSINGADRRWRLLGFLDDDRSLHGSAVLGHSVIGGIDWADRRDLSFVVAVGDSGVRGKIVRRISESGPAAVTLVHPGASVHESSAVGPGSILCRGSSITVRATLGANCIVNLHCTIGHDCVVGDGSTLHPGVHLSGGSQLGRETEIGTGAVVLPGVRIGAGTVVGAGAVVTRDLPGDVVAVGAPARVTRELTD